MSEANGIYYSSATINGSDTSNAVNSSGGVLAGIYVPASMAGSSLTLTTCDTESGTYVPIFDHTNTQVSITIPTAGTARFMSLRGILPFCSEYIKVVSSTTETSKTLRLAFQRVF